ncbi:hypothetical protein JXQ31_14830 [candidate division KSB1 bacterium]|nr:hypothetical protein [candidate division KSB1 bacterium]
MIKITFINMRYDADLLNYIKFFICRFILLCICFYFSQSPAQDIDILSTTDSFEVPIHFQTGTDHFNGNAYVTFRINTTDVNLFLDTGAPWATIHLTPAALEKVSVRYTGKTKKNSDSWGNKYKSREYKIPEVKIGGFLFKDIVGVEHKFRDETDGLFSFKLFENNNLLIDYPGRKLGIYSRETLPGFLSDGKWEKVKYTQSPDGEGIRLPVKFTLSDKTFYFSLDNAAIAVDDTNKPYGLIRLGSSLGKLLREKDLIIKNSPEPAVVGTFTARDMFIGSAPIAQYDFMIIDNKYPKSDGLIGYDLFVRYPVFIDFMNKELYLKMND